MEHGLNSGINNVEYTKDLIVEYIKYSAELTEENKYLDVLNDGDIDFVMCEDTITVDGFEYRLTIYKSDIRHWIRQSKLKKLLDEY
jgi:hypothetical protein